MRPPLVAIALVGLVGCSHEACSTTSEPPAPRPSLAPTEDAATPRARPIVPSGLEGVELVTGRGAPSDPLPLIVGIHGLGDDPERFAGLFDGLDLPARVLLPQGPEPYGRGYMWMTPFGGEAEAQPQIEEATDRIAGLIEETRARVPLSERTIVTGFSQGGILTFVLASRHPTLLSAAVPVSGRLPRPAWPPPRGSRSTPIVTALHGSADRLIDPMPARRGVVHLRRSGWDARIRLYDGVEHRISPRMRRDLHELLRAASEGRGRGLAPCPSCPGESVDPAACALCSD